MSGPEFEVDEHAKRVPAGEPLIDVLADDGEPPGPTLGERAQTAQDRIGWARMPEADGHDTEFASAVLDAARIVTEMAGKVTRLEREVESLRAEIAGFTRPIG